MLSRSTHRISPLLSRLSPSIRAYSNTQKPEPSRRVDDQPNSSSTTERVSDVITTNDPQPPKNPPNVSASNETPVSMMGIKTGTLQESTEEGEKNRVMQAPNRATTWSRSQQPRARAMSGPRFEQTIMGMQPQPYAAIDLIHKQPVRWTDKRTVACDGGGGPLGHPRIFINVDKPQICWCTYCGVPYAHEHHRTLLESQPSTTYPLVQQNDPAEVEEPQRVSDEAFAQR